MGGGARHRPAAGPDAGDEPPRLRRRARPCDERARSWPPSATMTDGVEAPRSLAATGGILLGPDYHFDLTRPGIGLYGGLPFEHARPVVRLSLPVIQVRDVEPGEAVGYGATWYAERPTRVATLAAGYADGLIRAMGNRALCLRRRHALPAGRPRVDGPDDRRRERHRGSARHHRDYRPSPEHRRRSPTPPAPSATRS